MPMSAACAGNARLGLLCQGEPFVIDGKVLAPDESGGMMLFDPAKHPLKAAAEWQIGGEPVAPPPEETGGKQVVLPAGDGRSALPQSGGARQLMFENTKRASGRRPRW